MARRKPAPVKPSSLTAITLNTPQVRLLLRGELVERRHPVGVVWPADLDPSEHGRVTGYWLPYTRDGRLCNGLAGTLPDDCGVYAPFKSGDVVAIREPYRADAAGDGWIVTYEADGGRRPLEGGDHATARALGMANGIDTSWWPARGMPESFTRMIQAEVVGMRVERLRDITEAGAKAEGCARWTHRTMGPLPGPYNFQQAWARRRDEGERLPASEENPWVFVPTLRAVLSLAGAPPVPVVMPGWPPSTMPEARRLADAFLDVARVVPGMSEDHARAYLRLFGQLVIDDAIGIHQNGAMSQVLAGAFMQGTVVA